jgi:hypothetical protein
MSHGSLIGRFIALAMLGMLVLCGAPALATAAGHWTGTYSLSKERHGESTSGEKYEEKGSVAYTLTGQLVPTSTHVSEDPETNLWPAVTVNSFKQTEHQSSGCHEYKTVATGVSPEPAPTFNIRIQGAKDGAAPTYTLVWPGINLVGTWTDKGFEGECGGFLEEQQFPMTIGQIPSEMSPQAIGTDPTHLAGSFGDKNENESWQMSWDLHMVESPDTDGDGLSDYLEKVEYGTNPDNADTDGDGYSDGQEVAAGTDPLDPNSHPGSPGPGSGGNGKEGSGPPPPPPPPGQRPIYMALGDSYSSGEGACPDLGDCKFDYISGTDFPDIDECHRSIYSYPQRTILRQPQDTPFFDRACSGAVIQNLYGAQVREGHLQRYEGFQLKYLQQAENEDPTTYVKYVTVGIGGNDADFSSVLSACVMSHYVGSHKALIEGLLDTLLDPVPGGEIASGLAAYKLEKIPHYCEGTVKLPSFSDIKTKLIQAYQYIAQYAPFATTYVMGYPKLFAEHPHGSCDVNSSDAKWLNSETARFDKTIQEAVRLAGVKAIYVDQVDAFRNHELCRRNTSSAYIQGLHPSLTNGKGYRVESFHPNSEGQGQFTADLDACVAVEATALTSAYCKPKHP